MSMKLKLGLWALSIATVTLSAAYADVALIGPNGRVVLFYKQVTAEAPAATEENPSKKKEKSQREANKNGPQPTGPREEVVVRYYQKYCVMPASGLRQDIKCAIKANTIDRRIAVPAFRAQLKTAFKVINDRGHYPEQTVEDRKIYQHRVMPAEEIKSLETELDALRPQLKTVQTFAATYGTQTISTNDLKRLEDKVAQLEEDINIQKNLLPRVVENIDAEIKDLIENLIGGEKITTLVLDPNHRQLNAAFLDAFLALPNLDQKFVTIKAGSFTSGSSSSSPGHLPYEKSANITLTHDFEIMSTEVTQGEWYMVMGDNPSRFNKKKYCPDQHLVIGNVEMCINLPVTNITYYEIQQFVRRLAGMNMGYSYRLPTEAEWEYAASEGKGRNANQVYAFDPKEVDNYVWHKGNSKNQPHQVASKKPNAFGLYDMFGNVAEFTDSDPSNVAPGGTNPHLSTQVPEKLKGKIIRGESFAHEFEAVPLPDPEEDDDDWIKSNISGLNESLNGLIEVNPQSNAKSKGDEKIYYFRTAKRDLYLPIKFTPGENKITYYANDCVGLRLVRLGPPKAKEIRPEDFIGPRLPADHALSEDNQVEEKIDRLNQEAAENEANGEELTGQDDEGNSLTNSPAPMMLTTNFGTAVHTNLAIEETPSNEKSNDQDSEKATDATKNKDKTSNDKTNNVK